MRIECIDGNPWIMFSRKRQTDLQFPKNCRMAYAREMVETVDEISRRDSRKHYDAKLDRSAPKCLSSGRKGRKWTRVAGRVPTMWREDGRRNGRTNKPGLFVFIQ